MDIDRKIFMGIVEDNKDPNRKGRIKVRVQTLYHCIKIEDIPYASPFAGLAGKRFEVPAIGKIVNVIFLNNDLYDPYYIYSENYNINLQNKLKNLSESEYVDFISLLFDEKTQIYVKGEELTIDQLLNKITITNDTKNSINLELKDNRQILNLGSRNSDQEAVLGTRFFEWMDKFIDELSNPASLIGNMGAPILKPKLSQLCQEYKLKRPNFVSNNVRVVDNGEVEILKRTPDTDNRKNDVDLIIPKDECSEYEIPEGGEDIYTQLNKLIQTQNKKSCKQLKKAASTKKVPYVEHPSAKSNLELTSEEVLKVWDKNTQAAIDKLHPKMKPIVIKFFNLCEAQGYHLKMTSGFRSTEDQIRIKNEYVAAGKGKYASTPGNSPHEYGIAIDVTCERAGKVGPKLSPAQSSCFDYPDCNEDWLTIGKIGKSVGLRWGLDFNNAKEAWHFDMYYFLSDEMQAMWMNNKKNWPKGSDGWINIDGKPSNENINQYNQQNYAATEPEKTEEVCESLDKFNQKDPIAITNAEADKPETITTTTLSPAAKKPNTAVCTDKVSIAMEFFTSRGYSKEQAAGIVGNLMWESGGLNINASGDNGVAHGLAQWHPDRQARFLTHFNEFSNGIPHTMKQSTFEEQLAFVDWELNNTHKSAKNKLIATNNPGDAALAINKYYEGSADVGHVATGGEYAKREQNRIDNSYQALNCYQA